MEVTCKKCGTANTIAEPTDESFSAAFTPEGEQVLLVRWKCAAPDPGSRTGLCGQEHALIRSEAGR